MKAENFGTRSVWTRNIGHPETNRVSAMAHDRIAVLVTYVGGPLHGQQHHLETAPQQLWRELPDGAALLYACRIQSDAHAVYAPVGMADHVFLDLLPTVERSIA